MYYYFCLERTNISWCLGTRCLFGFVCFPSVCNATVGWAQREFLIFPWACVLHGLVSPKEHAEGGLEDIFRTKVARPPSFEHVRARVRWRRYRGTKLKERRTQSWILHCNVIVYKIPFDSPPPPENEKAKKPKYFLKTSVMLSHWRCRVERPKWPQPIDHLSRPPLSLSLFNLLALSVTVDEVTIWNDF